MELSKFLGEEFQAQRGSMKINISGTVSKYKEAYENLKDRRDTPFTHEVYCVRPGDRIIVVVHVPSESLPGFQYDTAFEFLYPQKSTNFADCNVKFFSNSPSYIYSIAYLHAHWDPDADPRARIEGNNMMVDVLRGTMPKNNLLISGLERKIGSMAVKNAPVQRNPLGIPILDKSLYLGAFYILDQLDYSNTIMSKNYVSMSRLAGSIRSFKECTADRNKAAAEQKANSAAHAKATQKQFEEHEKSIQKANSVLTLKAPEKPQTAKASRAVRKPRSPRHF